MLPEINIIAFDQLDIDYAREDKFEQNRRNTKRESKQSEYYAM